VIRRSAAVGLASVLKGLGMDSIRAHGVMPHLDRLIHGKSNANGRQGAVFAYECMFHVFGYPFEPYIMKLVPHLVKCFDDNSNVRESAENSAAVIFGHLSAFAVRRLLPQILEATGHKKWSTKAGAATCLGAMGGCAKSALTASLPLVVPKLADLVGDANPQVATKASKALEQICAAITNPEINAVTPILLSALTAPKQHTKAAINSLMGCSYVHPIDPASLALLMPILHWGLKDTSADTKRAAAQVAGSASNLVKDDCDLQPYLARLVPALQNLVLDSIPETRQFASKSLGMLVHRFGEEEAPELVPWLVTKLEGALNEIERDGAAMCLAETLSVIGVQRLTDFMPELREKLKSTNAMVRAGFMAFMLHLPVKFPESLKSFIPELYALSINGALDGNTPVKNSAMELGVQLMQVYYKEAESLLLPAIEDGLQNDKYKTSSVRLLGYLLARMAGVYDLKLNPDATQAADVAVNKVDTAQGLLIVKAIGQERRDQILATLCLHRNDADPNTANMAGRVLRSVCENLKQTQEEIGDVLIAMALEMLTNDEVRQRQLMAARTLGSMVSMMFDRVMGAVMPLCGDIHCHPTNHPARHLGSMSGLKEICVNSHKDKIGKSYIDIHMFLLGGLCSDMEPVRVEAVALFHIMRQTFMKGKSIDVHDSIIAETMLGLLDAVSEGRETAVDAIRRLITDRGLKSEKKRDVFTWLETHLSENPPIGEFAPQIEEVMAEGQLLWTNAKGTNAKAEKEKKEQEKLDKSNAKASGVKVKKGPPKKKELVFGQEGETGKGKKKVSNKQAAEDAKATEAAMVARQQAKAQKTADRNRHKAASYKANK